MDLYSTEHIIFIVLTFVFIAVAALVFKLALKTDRARDIFIRCVGGLLAVSLIINRISLVIWNEGGFGVRNLIPNTYCGMTGLLLGLAAAFGKRDMKIFHFLVYVEIVGGFAAIFYPNFLDQDPSFFYMPTITGMNHHACGLILCVLLILGKWFEPSVKRWHAFPFGFGAYILFGLFLIDPLGMTGAMNIEDPIIPNTPLTWWFLLLAGTAAITAFSFVYEIVKARLVKKKKIEPIEQTAPIENKETTEITETANN